MVLDSRFVRHNIVVMMDHDGQTCMSIEVIAGATIDPRCVCEPHTVKQA